MTDAAANEQILGDKITVGNIENTTGVAIGAGAQVIVGYTAEQVSVLITEIKIGFQPKPFDGTCPYVGLVAFEEDDKERFFGRETLVGELVERVKQARFVVIAGPSGSGKSSVVRAGLIPQLKSGALPKSEQWLYESLKPGRNPLNELARVASSLTSKLEAGDDIRNKGMNDPTILQRWVEIAFKDQRNRRAILLVDQFEELFTQVADEKERVAFLNLLIHAATVENGQVSILFTLRSDFVSNCALYPQLNSLLNQQFIQVGPMLGSELVSAIARPALQVGLRIDPDLVAQVVNDMSNQPGALPLMQFALKDLFDAQQAKGGLIALTLDDYLARGGIGKALQRYADEQLKQLQPDEQTLARSIFSGLIQVGQGSLDTRRTATVDELTPAGMDKVNVRKVIDKLAHARLITTDEHGDKDIATISHERLIEAWPWLQRLVNENRDVIALQNQINEDAARWELQKHDASYLYTGARLHTVQEQLQKKKLVLSGLAKKLVDTSIAAQEKARKRRNFMVAGVMGLLSLATAISIWFAFDAQAKGEIAFVRQLTAQAELVYEENPLLGLRLALEADAHLNQEDEALRTQIHDSVDRYVQQGRIAKLSDSAKGILDVPGTEWLVVQQNGTDKADELRRKSDGAKGPDLPGSVNRVDTVSEGSPFFVIWYYEHDRPSELRRKSDGLKMTDLPGSVVDVNIVSDGSPFFVITYAGSTPGELRSKSNGEKVTDLPGSIDMAVNMLEDFPYFFIRYAGSTPGELRRKSDGEKVPDLAGSVSTVSSESENKDFPFFVIYYDDNSPNELRRRLDGSKVTDLAGSVEIVDTVSEDFPFFVIRYDDYRPSELRRKSDGIKVTDLFGVVERVDPLSEDFPFFVISYHFNTPSELRRKLNGANVTGLSGEVDRVYRISKDSPFFIIEYVGNRPGELRRKGDVTKVVDLPGPVSSVHTASEDFPFFGIDYYVDSAPSELRRKSDGAKVTDLPGLLYDVYPMSEDSPFFVVDYYDDRLGELRRKSDGAKVADLPGSVERVDTVSEDSAFFLIRYDDDRPAELRRKSDGSKMTDLPGEVDRVVTVSEDSSFFIIDYIDEPDELRRKGDGTTAIEFSGSIDTVDPVSEDFPFFIIIYPKSGGIAPRELRRKSDGTMAIDLLEAVNYRQTVARQTVARQTVARETVARQTVAPNHFFLLRSDNQHTELWQIAPLQRLVDLEIGVPWTESSLADDSVYFNQSEQTLTIRYEDGRVYLLDLAWLAQANAPEQSAPVSTTQNPLTPCCPSLRTHLLCHCCNVLSILLIVHLKLVANQFNG